MIHPRRALSLLAVLIVALATGSATSAQRGGDDKKPSLSLRATPPVGFSGATIVLSLTVYFLASLASMKRYAARFVPASSRTGFRSVCEEIT